ncbi:hypothetical protein GOB57_21835 [Sinorhizobium meliloti]|nr:hypothetical protein [Sinorhizobium meliloti]
MAATGSTPSLATHLGTPERVRWVNFDAYEMKLKMAVYKDGSVLVAENGEPHSSQLAALGFRKLGEEWIRPDARFVPRDFIALFPDARVEKDVVVNDVFLDRRTLGKPFPVDAEARRSLDQFARRIVSQMAKEPAKLPDVQVWFAEALLYDHTVQAFGVTPEQAMAALVEAWTIHAHIEGERVSLLVEFRDCITVNPAELGKGFAKGVGDNFWYRDGYNGADQRFDEILAKVPSASATPGMRP